ncbi:AraC family transcriptional regulator [Cochleicola gelatinilyticus]|uniref:HTH araC/xylS-type domain-containing protein n=1 Tax=Cochleicola gelatinilyticus TaxID=1763537 RepID=A0A167IPK1_9FLAO|nr:helix-turn-helix domain-containing protein [Cochleicola gelatinilyticus]OAB79882.1 hypothetical protein ULVI_03845 [Cochleicola gelatinilyticus]
MNSELPRVGFDKKKPLDIEVMKLSEMYERITAKLDHDPFSSHRIDFYLILLVTKGTYSHFVDFKTFTLKEGSVLFIAKNQVHHFTESLKNTEGYFIVISTKFFEQHYIYSKNLKLYRLYNYHIESPVIHQVDMGLDDFKGIVSKMYFEYHFPDTFAKNEIIRHQLHLILLKAERIKHRLPSEILKPRWIEKFTDFKNLLEKNYVKTRSSRSYASEINISYKLLNDITKSLRGKTTKSFIDEFVTTEIKRYLAATSYTVKEICYLTGFDEPANMSKFFKKNTSLTPLQYRNSIN